VKNHNLRLLLEIKMMLSEKKKRNVKEGKTKSKKNLKNQLQMAMIAQQVANTSPMCALPPSELYFLWTGNVKQNRVVEQSL
jgi:hypothetical protein